MTKRPIDITFAPDERLWRAVEKGKVTKDKTRVLPNSIRLQISVARSGKGRGTMEAAFNPDAPPKFNGIAEILVSQARSASNDRIRVVCVDEPTVQCEEHALIAFTTDAVPGTLTDAEVNVVRDEIAELFRVVKPPT